MPDNGWSVPRLPYSTRRRWIGELCGLDFFRVRIWSELGTPIRIQIVYSPRLPNWDPKNRSFILSNRFIIRSGWLSDYIFSGFLQWLLGQNWLPAVHVCSHVQCDVFVRIILLWSHLVLTCTFKCALYWTAPDGLIYFYTIISCDVDICRIYEKWQVIYSLTLSDESWDLAHKNSAVMSAEWNANSDAGVTADELWLQHNVHTTVDVLNNCGGRTNEVIDFRTKCTITLQVFDCDKLKCMKCAVIVYDYL